MEKQMTLFDTQDLHCGKTSQEHYLHQQQTEEKEQRSNVSLRNLSAVKKDAKTHLLCLSLQMDGLKQELSYLPMEPLALPGGSLTFNITDAPKDGNASLYCAITMDYLPQESILSHILVQDVDKKYRLSPRACKGILERAERRGKKLPEPLRKALLDTLESQPQ